MRRFASVIAMLFLLSTAAPIMACLTSAAMSHEESACCRAMHGNCGEMAKMGCCRSQVRADESPQLAVTAPAVDVHWVCVVHLTALAVSRQVHSASSLQHFHEHSPPGLLTAKITVLRI